MVGYGYYQRYFYNQQMFKTNNKCIETSQIEDFLFHVFYHYIGSSASTFPPSDAAHPCQVHLLSPIFLLPWFCFYISSCAFAGSSSHTSHLFHATVFWKPCPSSLFLLTVHSLSWLILFHDFTFYFLLEKYKLLIFYWDLSSLFLLTFPTSHWTSPPGWSELQTAYIQV